MKTEADKLRNSIQYGLGVMDSGSGEFKELSNKIDELFELSYLEGQSSPKIKQLEWVLESGGWHISMTRFGVSYEIGESKNDGNFILYDILLTTTIHDTIDEAKAAAQADFEKRVMECLDIADNSNK